MTEPVALTEAEFTELARYRVAQHKLKHFCQLIDTSWICGPPHERMIAAAEALERGDITRLMFSCPPRIGKSKVFSVALPVWYLGRNPSEHIALGTYGQELANDLSRLARNTAKEWLPKVFRIGVSEESNAVDRWDLAKNSGGMVSVGVGGGLTGRGADLLILDDVVKDAADADSAARKKLRRDWYREVARTRLHPKGKIVNVQTRWREDDLAGWLQDEARSGGEPWTVVELPMVSEDGTLLDPQRWPLEEVEKIKRGVGERAWQALYQQNPLPATGTLFKKQWLKYWDSLPGTFDYRVIAADFSVEGNDDNDFTVFQYWGSVNSKYYLIDQVRGHWNYPVARAKFLEFCNQFQADVVVVELAANGRPIVQELRDKIPGLTGIVPKGAKNIRAMATAPLWEAGQVYIPERAFWRSAFESELLNFPNGANDDQVDTCVYSLARLKAGSYTPSFTALPSRYGGVM